MKSNLDVWAVQSDKDETRVALENVKKDSKGNILYLNCWCEFTIGKKAITNRLFDSCFYSEESDTVILFAKGKISEADIEAYLKEANVEYTVIRFKKRNDEYYRDDEKFPEVWIAREKYVLRDAIDDSLQKGERQCVYYPEVESNLSLSYSTTTDESCEIEGRACKGLLVFKNKIVLLVNQKDKRNVIRESSVTKLLEKKDIDYKVKYKSMKKTK